MAFLDSHFFDEKFWLAVSFVVFIYFVYKPLRTSIKNALDSRVAAIAKQVEEAKVLRQEAMILLAEAEKSVANIHSLRQSMLKEASDNAKQVIEERTQEMQRFLDYKTTEAVAAINNQKQQACYQIQQEFATTATKIVAEYCKDSKNSSLSDTEIADILSSDTRA